VQPTPAILLTGASGAAKQAFARALLAARPAGEHWAILDNDNSHLTTLQENAQLSVANIIGCMCCTGQLALQTGIVQLLRRSHPQRLIIVVSSAAEPDPLTRALQQEYLAHAVTISHQWFVAAPEDLTPDLPSARLLRLQQLQAADMVVASDAAHADALRAAATALGVTDKRVATTAEALRTLAPIASTARG
jgi:G3E family GTPase